MTTPLFSPASADQTSVPAGQFNATLEACQQEMQTGLMDVEFLGQQRQLLLFARGRLVNVYRDGQQVEHLDPVQWQASINGASSKAFVRSLVLTPQAVRIIKVLIEQHNDPRITADAGLSLEEQFSAWREQLVLGLAHVRWPSADALVIFPGKGASSRYSLFVSAEKISHSVSASIVYDWKETPVSSYFYSSEPRTPAWTEYLLHVSFSKLVSSLLVKMEELAKRDVLNEVIRDIIFTSSAHDWNVSIRSTSFTDQTIFTSPEAAAKAYGRILEVIIQHFENAVGQVLLDMLVYDTVARLTPAQRDVLKDYGLVSG